jgi:hypothetical protein
MRMKQLFLKWRFSTNRTDVHVDDCLVSCCKCLERWTWQWCQCFDPSPVSAGPQPTTSPAVCTCSVTHRCVGHGHLWV